VERAEPEQPFVRCLDAAVFGPVPRGPSTQRMIGQQLDGKYDILRLIGEGGMGAVYEARNRDSGGRCAVKVINDEAVAKDEVLIARFEREAYAAKKVVSPNIVEILAAGHDDKTGHPYMVMEMLDGENALQLLKRIGPLPPELAICIGLQTCMGLSRAHEEGVVHRDIKPANLFLTDVGNGERVVKLLDFGVAKFKMDQASESDNESLTRTGSMLGSPMYMSPEQARGLKTIDHRADLWSLGIVLHQLLSGRVPHQDIDGLGELIITICSEPPPLVSDAAPWVPRRLAEVISGALKLSTDERYQSAKVFGEALRSCLRGDGRIRTDMMVRLTDEQRRPAAAAAPAGAAPTTKTLPIPMEESGERRPAAAGAQPAAPLLPALAALPVAHDATVALADVEAEMAKARAEREQRGVHAPTPAETPAALVKAVPTAPAGGADLAATVALPDHDFSLPPENAPALTAKAAPAAKAPAATAPRANDAKPSRERDASALAKHREAQRAAMDAARLAVPDSPEKGKTGVVLAILAGLAIGGGGLALYYFKLRDGGKAVPSATAQPPASTPAPTPPPPPTTAEPEPRPSATPSSSAAAPTGFKLKVSPEYATFVVNGTTMRPRGGYIDLPGDVGETKLVKVTVPGFPPRTVKITLTDKGPEPASIDMGGGAAPAPSAAP
jgi:serine/threonine-protein kinase